MTRAPRAGRAAIGLLAVCLLSFGAGCAGSGWLGRDADGSKRDSARPMDQPRLEQIFADQVEAITGPSGAIQTQVAGVVVYCISDPARDQMRLIAPITRAAGLDPRIGEVLLRANFNNTGESRYAVSEDAVFAVYLHPLSSLTPDEIRSALAQVVSLAKTFGTTFSSEEWLLPDLKTDPTGEEQRKEIDDNPNDT